MQNLKHYNPWYVYATQRNGNDKNGNPIYLVNIYAVKHPELENGDYATVYHNVNYLSDRRKDKNENIIVKSYNVDIDAECIIQEITNNL